VLRGGGRFPAFVTMNELLLFPEHVSGPGSIFLHKFLCIHARKAEHFE
jgi:hypothetical protein